MHRFSLMETAITSSLKHSLSTAQVLSLPIMNLRMVWAILVAVLTKKPITLTLMRLTMMATASTTVVPKQEHAITILAQTPTMVLASMLPLDMIVRAFA